MGEVTDVFIIYTDLLQSALRLWFKLFIEFDMIWCSLKRTEISILKFTKFDPWNFYLYR